MEADAILRQTAYGVVQRIDALHGELLVLFDSWGGIDHVPVLGDGRVVDLQDQAGIDDGLVFVVHRVGAGVQEFLVGLVVGVGDARGTAWGDRAHEALLDAGRLHRRLEIRDVGRDCFVAGVGDWGDTPRCRRARPGGDAELGVCVGRGELAAIAAIAEAGQYDLAGTRAARRGIERAGFGEELEPAEARP